MTTLASWRDEASGYCCFVVCDDDVLRGFVELPHGHPLEGADPLEVRARFGEDNPGTRTPDVIADPWGTTWFAWFKCTPDEGIDDVRSECAKLARALRWVELNARANSVTRDALAPFLSDPDRRVRERAILLLRDATQAPADPPKPCRDVIFPGS